ncbi:MAG TPA: NAD kinase [Comamonas sp.]|uniref:NAD kinase n=1 Tax=Comamonas halotolerans TaxID=3041496 RepID=UPI0024E0C326|nr:NAD kinase [Comamonas sp. NoAH]
MTSKFRHVALVGKYQTSPAPGSASEQSRQVLQDIADFLRAQGCEVVIEAETAAHTGLQKLFPSMDVDELGQHCDLGIVVGGDGTMLGIARQLAKYGTPLIGINQGRLGFVTDIPLDNYQQALLPMLHGEYEQESRPLMHARVVRNDETVFEALAMNDVVVNRGSTSGMVELRVEVDGRFVSNQRADGLIVATPTGATAYTLSVGGPLMHPSIPAWVMAPIAPHTLSNRPIVLSDQTEVMMEVVSGRDISANFDMQSLASLLHGDRIYVRRSEFSVRFLHPVGWNYFATLRKKLGWNEGGY